MATSILYSLLAVYSIPIIIGLILVIFYADIINNIESNYINRLDECQPGDYVIPVNESIDLHTYNYPKSEIIELNEDVVKLKKENGGEYHLYRNNDCYLVNNDLKFFQV